MARFWPLAAACRVLATVSDGRLDYVIFQGKELPHRHDVEVASNAFPTQAQAIAAVKQFGGSIPDAYDMVLNWWDGEHGHW
jgi:hypothetical protein